MKKFLLGLMIGALAIGAFAFASYAYAQTPDPIDPTTDGPEFPYGRNYTRQSTRDTRGNHGGMSIGTPKGFASEDGAMQIGMENQGFMQDYLHDLIADAFGLTAEDLDALNEKGVSIWDYALELGYTEEEIQTLMADAREMAILQALEDGTIDQEFADWMLSRMENMWGGGFGPGMNYQNEDGSLQFNGRGRGNGSMGNSNPTGSCWNTQP